MTVTAKYAFVRIRGTETNHIIKGNKIYWNDTHTLTIREYYKRRNINNKYSALTVYSVHKTEHHVKKK